MLWFMAFSLLFSLPLFSWTYVWFVIWLLKDRSQHLWIGSSSIWAHRCITLWSEGHRMIDQKWHTSSFSHFLSATVWQGLKTLLYVPAQVAPLPNCCHLLFHWCLLSFGLAPDKLLFFQYSMPSHEYTLI